MSKNKKKAVSRPLVYKPVRPDFFGSRSMYGLVMWFAFVFLASTVYGAWPSIVSVNGSLMAGAPTLYGLVAITVAGYALSLILGIAGMFIRPGDKDNDPTTVDYSIEVPPSGAPAHGLREKGYIFPDIANPFTFFYLYKKVVDVVLPDNNLCHQERWMWSWMRGLKNLMATPRSPSDREVAGMKRGGVYNNTDIQDVLTTEEVTHLVNRELGELGREWTEKLVNMHKMHVALEKKVNVMHGAAISCPTDSERVGSPPPTQANRDLTEAVAKIATMAKCFTENAATKEQFIMLKSVVDGQRERIEAQRPANGDQQLKAIESLLVMINKMIDAGLASSDVVDSLSLSIDGIKSDMKRRESVVTRYVGKNLPSNDEFINAVSVKLMKLMKDAKRKESSTKLPGATRAPVKKTKK